MAAMNDLESTTNRRLGVLLIVLGLLFAASSHLGSELVFQLWPLLVMGLGIGFVGIFAKRRGRGAFYLALGEYLILFSGLALYCNFAGWGCLRRLWPVFVAFLAVVFATLFVLYRRRRFLLFFALMFFLLSAFFLLYYSLGSEYWWTILILAGLSILLTGRRR